MAIRYVRSTDGSNADSGATWALAKANLNGGANGDIAGDTVYVSQVHSETSAVSIFFDWAGSASAPVKVICANDAAEPPTTAATSAIVEVTGASSQIQISGSHYCYGISYKNNGTGATAIWLHNSSDQIQLWEQCSFQINSATASNLYINATSASTGNVKWRNCTVLFGNASSNIIPQCDKFLWEGGSVLSGGTAITTLFTLSTGRTVEVDVRGVDFSNCSSALYIIGTNGGCRMTIRNCKLPAAWTGGIYNGTIDFAGRVEMYNCDSGTTNYKFLAQDPAGTLQESITVKRTSGSTDGFTAYTMLMTSNANCNLYYGEFPSLEIAVSNDIVGADVTLSIDIAHDSLTALNNDEVRLQVEYLGSTTSTQSTIAHNGLTTPLTAATAHAASTNAWTTTGLANANVQTLSITVTPQQRGFLLCKIILTKASYPIYVDTKIQLS